MSYFNYKPLENWQRKILLHHYRRMVVGIEKHVQNEHLLNNTVKELVINLEPSDSNTSKEVKTVWKEYFPLC
jgi:hypothetical protein